MPIMPEISDSFENTGTIECEKAYGLGTGVHFWLIKVIRNLSEININGFP